MIILVILAIILILWVIVKKITETEEQRQLKKLIKQAKITLKEEKKVNKSLKRELRDRGLL